MRKFISRVQFGVIEAVLRPLVRFRRSNRSRLSLLLDFRDSVCQVSLRNPCWWILFLCWLQRFWCLCNLAFQIMSQHSADIAQFQGLFWQSLGRCCQAPPNPAIYRVILRWHTSSPATSPSAAAGSPYGRFPAQSHAAPLPTRRSASWFLTRHLQSQSSCQHSSWSNPWCHAHQYPAWLSASLKH